LAIFIPGKEHLSSSSVAAQPRYVILVFGLLLRVQVVQVAEEIADKSESFREFFL
jgi:hypothetical protein